MTHHILTIQNYLQNPVREILNTLADLRTKYQQRREIKQAIKELRALSDRELSDIGITRGEIYDVVHGMTNQNLKGWV